MRRCGLWQFVVRTGLHGVNQVRELDGILDEEHRHVVPNDIEVAFICVPASCQLLFETRLSSRLRNLQSSSKTVNISSRIGTTPGAGNGGETYKGGCLLALGFQEGCRSKVTEVSITSESSISSSASCMDGSLGNLNALC